MGTLKAAAQAGVAMVAITIAIARHLVNNGTGPGSSFVRRNLSRSNQAGLRQLLLRENGRERSACFGRSGMERRNLSRLIHELGMRHGSGKKNGDQAYKMLHIMTILPQNKSH